MAKHLKARGFGLAVAAMLVIGALLLPASATAHAATTTTPGITLTSPNIPGVAPLPGPTAEPAAVSPNMGILTVTPQQGVIGTPMTISGSNLPPNESVELTWSTADVTWVVDPEPDTVNYLGRSSTPMTVVLRTTTTGANGSFSVTLEAPNDWGGIHNIYAVVNGVEDSHGGFIILRKLTVTPRSGPVGTPITVTYSGIGASLYEGGASLLYDNHYVGEMMANWTRGTARVTIRATGAVGPHTIQVGDAISFLYLNYQQSPLPYINGGAITFWVTKNDGPLPPSSMDWPVDVAPTVSAKTTLVDSGLSKSGDAASKAGGQPRSGRHPRRAHRVRVDVGESGSARVVHRRRQPRQLHQHLLELRFDAARYRGAVWGFVPADDQDSRRSRRMARRPARSGWSDGGTGAFLRRGEHRRARGEFSRREGGTAVHHPPERCRMDTARQHRRG